MANNYEGGEFIGIDAVGVESAVDQQPVDTGLRRRLQANMEYLLNERESVACTFQGGDIPRGEGAPYIFDRPWASVSWSCVICVPFWLEAGVIGARVSLWLSYVAALSRSQDFQIRLAITDGTLRRVLAQDVHRTDVNDFSFEEAYHQDWEAQLSAPYSGRPHYGSVQVWIKSGLDTVIQDQGAAATAIPVTRAVPITGIGGVAVAQPQYGQIPVAYIESDSTSDVADILGVITGQGSNTFVLDRPFRHSLPAGGNSGPLSRGRKHICCFPVNNCSFGTNVAPECGSTGVSGMASVPPAGGLLPSK